MALLTVSELRTAISTSLTDARLQELLDASEQDIIGAAGTVTDQTEHVRGGCQDIVLARPVGAIGSIVERADTASTLTLHTSDYRVHGYMIRRLDTGLNPRLYWWPGLVKVVHDPADRLAERKRAQVAVCQLDINQQAGVTSERVGDWAASYGSNPSGTSYLEQRAAILDSLAPVLVA
jgi:hypothetical protein